MKHEILPRNTDLRQRSRDMRNVPTKHERILWNSFLRGFSPRFTRQRIIGSYIADFFCHKAMLAVELDGAWHSADDAADYDQIRTEYLASMGISVLRFSNAEIDNSLTEVFGKIAETVKKRTEQEVK
ncbi:MAG: DUF559 domain-containing protein [Oscillospiraceae bacterium]|jgi:very-short-patch-repair endonuclease|nr:DUF559 domain-containing protein [Oscillospiraceae bacterium]